MTTPPTDIPTSPNDIPEEYTPFTIQKVEQRDDVLLIHYDNKMFGGIVPELLQPGILEAITPGKQIIVRYHTPDSGRLGQVVHMLLRHPTQEGWAELYADWE